MIFEGFGKISTRIYQRELLPIGIDIIGPAIIEEPTSSTVVYPDQVVMRDKFGFLQITQTGIFSFSFSLSRT